MKGMSFFRFYIILTLLGVFIDILGLILSYNQAPTELLAICFITSVLFLIIGIRGIAGKLKSYM